MTESSNELGVVKRLLTWVLHKQLFIAVTLHY